MPSGAYIEVNLICLILHGIIFLRLYRMRSMLSMSQKIMKCLTLSLAFFAVTDIIASICNGLVFPFSRAILELSNLIYLELIVLFAVLWFNYVCNRTGTIFSKKSRWLLHLPTIFFTLFVLSNPFTHLLFIINNANCYERGPGVFAHWMVSWFYFICAGVVSASAVRSAEKRALREEYVSLLHFLILPAIGCITQMLFYGTPTILAGITLSLVLFTLQVQDNQISSDELTGINNRKALRNYVDSIVHSGGSVSVTVMMIDVNKLKMINDTYGHAAGDSALKDVAAVLKRVCGSSSKRLFLCRFGGDEFVIIGRNLSQSEVFDIIDAIHNAIATFGENRIYAFPLRVSVGYAGGTCSSEEDFSRFLTLADASMYDEKKKQAG